MFLLVLVLNLTFPQTLTQGIDHHSFFWSLSTPAVSDLICHHEKQSSRGWHLSIKQVTFPHTALESQVTKHCVLLGISTGISLWSDPGDLLKKIEDLQPSKSQIRHFQSPVSASQAVGSPSLPLILWQFWKEINIYIYGYSYERKELNHNKNPSLDRMISLQISLYKNLILEEAWIVRKLQSVQGQLSSNLQVKQWLQFFFSHWCAVNALIFLSYSSPAETLDGIFECLMKNNL